MKNKKKRMLFIILGFILLSIWFIAVVKMNQRRYAVDNIPIEDYQIGEIVRYDHDFAYGTYFDGYALCANSYKMIDTEDYLKRYQKKKEDFNSCFEKVCVVDMTVYKEKSKNSADEIFLTDIMMHGLGYYTDQNTDFFMLENPNLKGSCLSLEDGSKCNVRLVFNIRKDFYTAYNWKNINKIDMKLAITSFPVEKNIVLQ